MKYLSIFENNGVIGRVKSDWKNRPRSLIKQARDEPIRSSGRWVSAQDLKVGDILKGYDKKGKIKEIRKVSVDHIKVYNLSVEKHHNYTVSKSKFLVHNK